MTDLSRFRHVLFLGAHPDDEMGCSGLLFELAQRGARIRVCTFSRCDDLNGPELIDEWKSGLNILGIDSRLAHDHDRDVIVDTFLMDLPNRRLPEHRQFILEVLDIERQNGPENMPPDLVLCPTTFDAHQDHAVVAIEARRAFKDTTVLGYELPLNSFNGVLSAYVELSSDAMDAKQMHAAAYRSQRAKPYMNPSYIEGLARVRGVQSGARWAEAFEVIRWVL